MNTQIYDLLNAMTEHNYTSQRDLSAVTGYSLGMVNQSLGCLVEEGYLTREYGLTGKAEQEAEQKRPANAIILAAGFGLRMVPINREVPKGLVEVKGEPLIERQIRQLHEAGIWDITVIVGFMKEAYEYLIDDYGVKLLVNGEYAIKNNLHSLFLARNQISNTYIVPCDIWCSENPFSKREWYSWYMVTEIIKDDSFVRVNRKKELAAVERGKSGNEMIGISYVLEKDAKILRKNLQEMEKQKIGSHAFWEEACMQKGKMLLASRLVSSQKVFEINTYEDLREADEDSRQLKSEVLSTIAGALGCSTAEMREIRMLKKGMTNRSFQFSCREKEYIMRIPGEGTDQLIDRKQEYQVYQAVADLGLSDTVRYFEPEKGYKLTEFIPGTRVCDSGNREDVLKCMAVLRKFHESGKKVSHTFDLFEKIDFYESLWDDTPSCYKDYRRTKEKIWELKKYLEGQPKRWTLCHIDSVPDNFLITDSEIRLIDWEYAGMQDADVDIAMFAVYALYERDQIDALIDAYYTEGCPKNVRRKIYAYLAVCGLLWSNWCEYKHHLGVEFGEYSLRQYRYAKEYYKIWKEEF